MIRIEHVSFGYADGTDTLYDFSLTIPSGACILLCGESGCGKTTVTKLINGLIPHFTESGRMEGTVWVKGQVVADTELYELAKQVGSVFQNPKSQFFNLDTDSELAFGLENQGVAPEQMEQRVSSTVKDLHITSLLQRNIFSLSGGEKQTLAFASVYATKPAVFVLDEPTANLDETAIRRLREMIALLKRQGHTVVIAEHRLYFLEGLIDQAVYIRDGHLKQIFEGADFWRLSEAARKDMGLRCLTLPGEWLPESRTVAPDKVPEDESRTAAPEKKCEGGRATAAPEKMLERESEVRGDGPGAAGRSGTPLKMGKGGLEVEKLTCGYKKHAPVFADLSFSAASGEVLAITGPNGIGKTTLTRCLCGLLKESSGRVLLDGQVLKQKERRRSSFLVMQDVNHQLFYDSVWNECEQAAGGNSERIEEVLKLFDLLDFQERHPMSLSGGQKQRLAVATAVLSKKKVLLFDEPTSGLDYRHMKEVSKVIRGLAKRGHIVMVVSHDREFMVEACDRALELGMNY